GQAVKFSLPPGLLGESPLGGLCECDLDGRIPGGAQVRQQFVADAGAGKTQTGGGRVLAPCDAAVPQVLPSLLPAGIQQWPYNSARRDRANSRQPCCAGATQEAEEHRFGLVGPRVSHSHAVEAMGGLSLTKKLEACRAGGLLPVAGY